MNIIGAGGHARVIIGIARAAGWSLKGIYDDDRTLAGKDVMGVPVIGVVDEVPLELAIIAVGDNASRARIARAYQCDWVTLTHPSAFVDPSARLEAGTVVCPGAVIQPEAQIGSHVIVNTSASVDHECTLADFSQIGPGAHLGGRVRVGTGAFIGLGSSVIQGLSIGEWAVVGAGAVVIRPVEANAKVVGNPARPL